jgi:predicted ATPase with chaperone activity
MDARDTFASVRPACRADERELRLSARAYHRGLKIARTVAALVGAANIEAAHVSEGPMARSVT